jgi:hypothetical protein
MGAFWIFEIPKICAGVFMWSDAIKVKRPNGEKHYIGSFEFFFVQHVKWGDSVDDDAQCFEHFLQKRDFK